MIASLESVLKNNVSTPLFSLQYYQTEKNYKNKISFFRVIQTTNELQTSLLKCCLNCVTLNPMKQRP